MAQHLYKLREKIRFRFRTHHNKGYGIHSPYLFRFITSVLQGKYPYYYFGCIESIRKDLFINPTPLHKKIFITRNQYRKEAHCGQIIFRIIQDAQFETLLELGTSTGMETQYMALANQKARCISVTESAESAAAAQEGFQKQKLNTIELQLLKPEKTPVTVINKLENLDFVLFNQIFPTQENMDLLNQCLEKKNNGSIFVFMNIHGNPDRAKIWKKILTHQEVQVTIDIYNLGIVLFNPELGKKNYVIRTK